MEVRRGRIEAGLDSAHPVMITVTSLEGTEKFQKSLFELQQASASIPATQHKNVPMKSPGGELDGPYVFRGS